MANKGKKPANNSNKAASKPSKNQLGYMGKPGSNWQPPKKRS